MKTKTIKFNFITFSLLLTPIIYAASDSAKPLSQATDNGNITEVMNEIINIVGPNENITNVINIIENSLDPNGNIADVINIVNHNIVNNNLDPRTAMEFGEIALILASNQGHYEIVEYLLKKVGINPNTCISGYKTLLMLASVKGHFNIAKCLLSLEDIDPNLRDNSGNTALIFAIAHNKKKIVNIILQHPDTETNISNIAGESALMMAVKHNFFDIVRQLLEHNNHVHEQWRKVNPNYLQGDNEQTPLMLASVKGYFEIVECLLSLEDIDPNLQDNFGNTALTLAIMLNQKKIANIILKHPDTETNPNMSNITDKSALMNFCVLGQFLAHKNWANPNYLPVENKQTPLMYASCQGNDNIVKCLIQNNFNLNLQDIYGQTALIRASGQGHENIVKILIQHNAEPGLQDSRKQTALMYASGQGHENIVNLLVQNNADPNTQNMSGQTALILANFQGHENIVKILIQHNANSNVQDIYRRTTLNYAKTSSISETLKNVSKIRKQLKRRQEIPPPIALPPFRKKAKTLSCHYRYHT